MANFSNGEIVGQLFEVTGSVGGEILGIDITSLFVAGAFGNASWILPTAVVAAAGIAVLGVRRILK